MSSMLSKIFPSLKSRLIFTLLMIISILATLIFSITYISMDRALDARVISQLETRFSSLTVEYFEELEEHEEHRSKSRSSKAVRELGEDIEEIQEVLEDRNEWVYLLNQEGKLLIKDSHSPEFDKLTLNHHADSGKFTFEEDEYLYRSFELPDGNYLIITADLSDKNSSMVLFRNRFVLTSILVAVLGILLCLRIISKSVRGFEKVRETAEKIASGDYSQRVHPDKNSSTEVTKLAESFNSMLDQTQILLKEIKEVSNNVAHDLRTPLTRIRGKVETTLLAGAELKEHKELSGIVIEECDKLMLLIDNMLTLAEYESGQIKPKSDKIDLARLLKDLVELFEPVAEDKNIQMTLELSSENLLILGDREKIQRSLSNLLDNAIKYNKDEGQIKVTAKIEGNKIAIIFSDTGCGISDEDQKLIFNRFYRGETSRTTPGNGLGLNLAKAFIENHGGKLGVTSKPGTGSEFTVLLPATS